MSSLSKKLFPLGEKEGGLFPLGRHTYKLEEVLPNGDQVFSRNGGLYMFEGEDIKKLYWTKESVIKDIYGLDMANVQLD